MKLLNFIVRIFSGLSGENSPYQKVCTYEDTVMLCKNDSSTCAFTVLDVRDIVRSLDELGSHNVATMLKLYTNALRLGKGTKVVVIAEVEPVDATYYERLLDRRIGVKVSEVLYEPSDIRAKLELERIVRLRRKIARGYEPFRLKLRYIVVTCNESDGKDLLSYHESRVKALINSLETLGVSTTFGNPKDVERLAKTLHNFR